MKLDGERRWGKPGTVIQSDEKKHTYLVDTLQEYCGETESTCSKYRYQCHTTAYSNQDRMMKFTYLKCLTRHRQ